MTTRYFKATDGTRTVFRASKTRVYRAAYFLHSGIAFSASAPDLMAGTMTAVEITKPEYQTLLALKAKRQDATGVRWRNIPSESWVRNEELGA